MDLKKYKQLIIEIDKLSSKYSIDNTKENRKEILLVGFSENIKCHYESILLLIEQKLYHSAFALIRVLFESIVRAKYSYLEFNEDGETTINEFYESNNWNDLFHRKFTKMCKYLDTKFEFKYYTLIKKQAYTSMCDYIHTGNLAIAKCFTDSELKPDFDDDFVSEILDNILYLTRKFYLFFFNHTHINHKITKNELIVFSELTEL